MSGWRPPSEVLTPEQLERSWQAGCAARAVVSDAAYRRAVSRLRDGLRAAEEDCAAPPTPDGPPP